MILLYNEDIIRKGVLVMAKGRLLKGLFESYSKNEQKTFKIFAKQIIEDEKLKNHHQLANDLTSYYERFPNSNLNVIDNHINDNYLHLLPKDKDSNLPLMETRTTDKLLRDLSYSDEFKGVLENIIQEHENKEILGAYNLKPKSKLLFCGPPGCGKTVTAEAIANELNLPILYTRFDSVVSSYLGETASNLRKLFDFIKQGDWILFFDEFDAIAKTRDSADEHGELKRVVNTFLQLLDAYKGDSIIIAATNHQQLLDRAIWRRFDEVAYFELPSQETIKQLVNTYLKRYPNNIDSKNIINKLTGFSHADIEQIFINSTKKSILNREELTTNSVIKQIEEYVKRNNLYNN